MEYTVRLGHGSSISEICQEENQVIRLFFLFDIHRGTSSRGKACQVETRHVKSRQVEARRGLPSKVQVRHVKSRHVKSSQVEKRHVKSSQVKSSQVEERQVKARQVNTRLNQFNHK